MSETSDNSTPPAKGTRTRSPAYPLFGLGEVVKRARLAWESIRSKDAHIDSVIHALGYASRNGQSLRAVAALSHYGLTEETGSGDNRRIRLSDMAQDILHLEESDPRRLAALRTAALQPSIHQALWERYGATLPPQDPPLRAYLIREKGYNDEAASDVIRNYRETYELAKLGAVTDNKPDDGSPAKPNEAPTAEQQKPSTWMDQFFRSGPQHPAAPPSPPFPPPSPPSPVTQELPILVDHGQVARIPFPMSEDAFDLLLGTLQLWKKKLVPPAAPPRVISEAPAIKRYPAPISAVWKNKDHDQPVRIIGELGEQEGVLYYQSSTGTGIPSSELTFT